MTTVTTPVEETMPKREFQNVQLQNIEHRGGMKLALNSFAELEKFSHFMALSNFVPKHLRGKQADCLAVLLQSQRWEMDPFAVAQKTYFVNDGMAYEAQLVNAIILSRAPLKARPKLKWSGEGESLKCEVSATFLGEDEPSVFEAEMRTITTKNSPLWKQQPAQQLGYYATRAWARLYCPDVLMGVYTKEEMETGVAFGSENAIDITPPDTSVVDNINAQLQATKKPKVQVVEHVNKESGEVTEITINDALHDIANIPTIEGLEFKFTTLSEAFKDRPEDFAQLVNARDVRKTELMPKTGQRTLREKLSSNATGEAA